MPNLIPVAEDYATPRRTRRELSLIARNPPFNENDAKTILEGLARGRGIKAISSDPASPPYWVINQWRRENPLFDELVVEASEAGAEAMLWKTLEIADDQERSPACRDIAIKARLHAMKVLNRKRFDPATRVEVSAGAVNPEELPTAELERIVARQIARGDES